MTDSAQDPKNGSNPPTKPAASTPPTSALRAESVPQELTGRASETGDDLAALFRSDAPEHLADGFSGGSDDDTGVALRRDGDGSDLAPEDLPAAE